MSASETIDYTSLHINDLDPSITTEDLKRAIQDEGYNVIDARVTSSKYPDGLSWANVVFATEDDAKRAIEQLNHLTLGKTEISIMYTRKGGAGKRVIFSATKNVFVKNIPEYMTSIFVSELFSNMFGDVETVRLLRDKDNKPRGYGYVLFVDPKSAEAAIEHSAKEICFDLEGKEHRCVFEIEKYMPRNKRAVKQTNIYIRRIPEDWEKEDLTEFGSQFGEVQSAVLFLNEERKLKYGFVNFFSQEDATKMFEARGKEFVDKADRPFCPYIQRYQNKKVRHQTREHLTKLQCNLFIANLPPYITEAAIENVFSPFGEIFSYALHMKSRADKDSVSKYPRAFVMYTRRADADKAIEQLSGSKVFCKDGEDLPLFVQPYRNSRTGIHDALAHRVPPGPQGHISGVPPSSLPMAPGGYAIGRMSEYDHHHTVGAFPTPAIGMPPVPPSYPPPMSMSYDPAMIVPPFNHGNAVKQLLPRVELILRDFDREGDALRTTETLVSVLEAKEFETLIGNDTVLREYVGSLLTDS